MDTENTALSPVPSDKPKLAASIYDWVETFCYAMALMVVLFLLVCRYVTVDGDSMRETLHDSDKLIISGLGYTPETGDIVVVKVPAYQNPIIKRVIATEGQEVEIDFENWTVRVDGVLLEEDYINRDTNYDGINDDHREWMAGSQTGERVLRAPCDGEFRGVATIGDHVEEGQVVAYAGDVPVVATLTGVLRGLIADGVQVRQGLKSGDVDPRDQSGYCGLVSDKGLAVAGGVLEAILHVGGTFSAR